MRRPTRPSVRKRNERKDGIGTQTRSVRREVSMGSFVPSTKKQRQEMLQAVGTASYEALYADVPRNILLPEDGLKLEKGVSELEAAAKMQAMAEKNTVFRAIFRGAGSYNHYIPAIVKRVTGKEQFLTAYTPYQAEISQGVLQSIFEYQTMICTLTGMEVSNASVYDGGTAAGEAAAMCRDRKRHVTLVSAASNPQVIETVKTYCWGANAKVKCIPSKDGKTDLEALKAMLGDDVAGVYVQQPSFFGQLEDMDAICEAVHAAGTKLIMGVNPIAAALLKTPGEIGADVAVGEGQPLGMPMGFGGPYLGFMAASKTMFRKLPGRIVGETTDHEGRRCYVLTLQAREQHIRREKASSNICSNEALCAMTAAVYLAAMGPVGMKQAAELCCSKAHYLAAELEKIGLPPIYPGPFFHEFVTKAPAPQAMEALEGKGILPGLPVENGILWCCTEQNTKTQMDEMVAILREVSGK